MIPIQQVQLSLLWLLVGTASATPLSLVRLDVDDGPAVAADLGAAGFDVLYPSVQATTLELIASDQGLQELRLLGHSPVVLRVGAPLAPPGLAVLPGYPDLDTVVARLEAVETGGC